MDFNQIALLIIAGLLAGFIAGGFGVGGGIIIVPALVFIFGMTQHEAQGTSLAVLAVPIGFVLAAANYHKKGLINYKFALILIVTFLIGSYVGSKLAVNLPAKTLKKAFGVLMLVAGLKIILGK
ncbi:MAG: sulfite exporter TauE/SafE family protein [Bacteroidales bacterium]|nr:sulfite exporter TauE/SafE family protein [Bacteroidales bacterium]MBN2819232.1 sulfite exporter TauE/SafE family protein [Bacteroidales bacterium]